ncbi:hypothetical protein ACTXT7_014850 [Hymenolepis weldensis]
MDPHAGHNMNSGATMDMSGSTGMSHNMHGMKMFFNTDLPFYLLFEAWNIDTVGKLVGACVGIFLLAFIYEAMKGLRDRLLVRNLSSFQILNRANAAIHDDSAGSPGASEPVNYENPVVPLVQRHEFAWRSYCSLEHILQTFLHGAAICQLLNRPPRSSFQNVLINAIIFEENPLSFAVLNDQHWWMINASNPGKSVSLNLICSQTNVPSSHVDRSLAGSIRGISYLILVAPVLK